jgi:hypothetical protein
MTRTQIVNRLILLSAALNKESFNGPLEQTQNAQILNGVLESEVFGEEVAQLEKDNIIFYGEQGYVPTRKGWDLLRPQVQTKVVNKMTTKPVEKMTDKELLDGFVDASITICDRMPRSKSLQKQAVISYDALFDAVTCVASTLNNNIVVEEVVVEETAPVKTSKKKATAIAA